MLTLRSQFVFDPQVQPHWRETNKPKKDLVNTPTYPDVLGNVSVPLMLLPAHTEMCEYWVHHLMAMLIPLFALFLLYILTLKGLLG